jgi:hypothetical protein
MADALLGRVASSWPGAGKSAQGALDALLAQQAPARDAAGSAPALMLIAAQPAARTTT